MNEKLAGMFGCAPGENVWRGKAVIVAFVNEADFLEFESAFMKKQDATAVRGRCHSSSNGRVIVAIYRGDSPSLFAKVLVHETAHGYVHRYKSNKRIPKWLNEGVADWIAGVVVPESSSVRDRQRSAALRLRTAQTLGGQFFEAKRLQSWQYGIGSSMVDLLIRGNNDAFRVFFDGIKEGLTWQDSLQRAYGATPDDLVTLYGRSIGIPNLTQ
jgi:hypothetical protein